MSLRQKKPAPKVTTPTPAQAAKTQAHTELEATLANIHAAIDYAEQKAARLERTKPFSARTWFAYAGSLRDAAQQLYVIKVHELY